jgi:glutamine amidotransferase
MKDLTHLIIPGVGSFAQAMKNIRERHLEDPILEHVANEKPLLGICLGMQLLAEEGTEPHPVKGLGVIKGKVIAFENKELRVPHVGWNGIQMNKKHDILESVKKTADFYFVHSYHFNTDDQNSVLAYTDYGELFPSIVANEIGNAVGVQFHPEKSQKQGIRILENFANL